ncbi:MAG: hypothetical protein ACLU1X_07610 [Peptoniphilus grossensis]
MKKFELTTKKGLFKNFNSIRSKKDIILLLLESIKNLMIYSNNIIEFNDVDIINNEDEMKIVIYIDKMKRIFYCTKNKVQSICFPFSVFMNNQIKFYYHSEEINYKYISVLVRVFSASNMNNSLNLIDSLLNDEEYSNSSECEQNYLEELILFLSTFEDGYLRFDFDDIENEDEKYHPLHHIDFYYSNSNTFKLGIMDKISLKKSIEIIDINKKCLRIT